MKNKTVTTKTPIWFYGMVVGIIIELASVLPSLVLDEKGNLASLFLAIGAGITGYCLGRIHSYGNI